MITIYFTVLFRAPWVVKESEKMPIIFYIMCDNTWISYIKHTDVYTFFTYRLNNNIVIKTKNNNYK